MFKPWHMPMVRAHFARLFNMATPVFTVAANDDEGGDAIYLSRGGAHLIAVPRDSFVHEFQSGRGYEYIDRMLAQLELSTGDKELARSVWRAWGHANT